MDLYITTVFNSRQHERNNPRLIKNVELDQTAAVKQMLAEGNVSCSYTHVPFQCVSVINGDVSKRFDKFWSRIKIDDDAEKRQQPET